MTCAAERTSIIFLSMHLPSESVPEAGQKICFQHLKTLAAEHDVHLVSCVNVKEKGYLDTKTFDFCTSTQFVLVDRWTRIRNAIRSFWLPYQVAVRRDSSISAAVAKRLRDGASAIHIEYEHGAFVLADVPTSINRTVVFHDVISQSAERRATLEENSLKRTLFRVQTRMAKSWEKKLMPLVDKAIVLNEKDKELLVAMGYPARQVTVAYPMVSSNFRMVRRDRFERQTMLFWGAMNRSENEDAVLWFVSAILPKILVSVPNATLLIVGANPSARVRALASSNLIVTGFVDDPLPYFEQASVAVVPLRFGAGIKLKVLEALAAGLTVIGTTVAAEGVIDDPKLIVADSEHQFAEKVVAALH